MNEPGSDQRLARGIFTLAITTYCWFFGGAGWNQDAQFDLTRALVERGTLHIDAYASNTEDVSVGRQGHVFVNKPPGVSFIAAIPYAFVFAAEKTMRLPVDALARINAWIVTAATCGVSGALIGATLFFYGRRIGASRLAALTVSLLILFGTIVFAYSTMLFAHVPSALFLLLALVCWRDRPLLAGMAAGAAASCFYLCAISTAVLALAVLSVTRRGGVRFIAGGLPFAVLLAIYHHLCFGSPWTTSLEASHRFTQKGLPFGVFHAPSVEAFWGVTFSPYRGLFHASPVLLFAFVGMVIMARRREMLPELFFVAATVTVFLLVISAFNGWNGGWAFGPRYLLPLVPLLGVPMMFATRIARPLWIILGGVSVLINFIAVAVGPMPPDTVNDPLRLWYLPIFSTGRLPAETLHILQWDEMKLGKVAVQREAGNLGESLCGKGTRCSIAPVIVWLVAGSGILYRRRDSP